MNKGVLWGICVGIAVIAIAAYALAQRPQRVVDRAIEKLASAQTEHFHAEIALGKTAAGEALLKDATDVTLALDGSFDRRGEARDSLVSDIIINAKSDSVTLEIAGELRLIEDKAYLFVRKAPAAIPLLAKLKDKWAELPRGAASEAATTPGSGPLFSEVKKTGRGKYEAVATQAGIINFMNQLAQILGTQLTDQQVDQLKGNLANTQSLPITLQISPVGHELEKLEVQLPNGGVHYAISFSDSNKPVNHEVPADAKPIRDILGS